MKLWRYHLLDLLVEMVMILGEIESHQNEILVIQYKRRRKKNRKSSMWGASAVGPSVGSPLHGVPRRSDEEKVTP